jgi:hypothetical protein
LFRHFSISFTLKSAQHFFHDPMLSRSQIKVRAGEERKK